MTEYASGHTTWRDVLGRAGRGLLPSRRRRGGWSLGVPVIALAAGLLFTTSATTAGDTPLRQDRRIELTELVAERQERVAEAEEAVEELRAEVETLTAALAGSDTPVRIEQERADRFRTSAGMTALHGPGLTITLDDARRPDGGVLPAGARPDELLVHQQDLQAIVNALWAGGAEAMSIMDVRVIATSAVICVGPVLLLHGRPYSPPYVIKAIGDPDAMRAALADSPGVQLYWEAVDAFGLGYRETVEEDIVVPAFEGTSTLRSGQVPR